MSTEAIIDGIRRHDRKIIRYVFDTFFPMIKQMVGTLGNGAEKDAEDIFMSGLEVIYLKTLDESFSLSCAFSTFLFEVCKRKWLSELRRSKRAKVTVPRREDPAADVPGFEEAFEKAERYALYREKFGLLDKTCRRVLELGFNKYSGEEIALAMGFGSAGYALKRKHTCKKRLFELIRNDPRYIELNGK
jgi:RNA polymerase sigma factor (sigma-70 family)